LFDIIFLLFKDEYSREPTIFTLSEGMEKPIDPISDVGIDQINHLMFGDAANQ
jgi:phosphatidylinositol N-acetylglucosaminyltransferase subunit P